MFLEFGSTSMFKSMHISLASLTLRFSRLLLGFDYIPLALSCLKFTTALENAPRTALYILSREITL